MKAAQHTTQDHPLSIVLCSPLFCCYLKILFFIDPLESYQSWLVLEDDTEIEIDLFGWTIYWCYKDKDEKKVQLIQQVIVVIRKINWNNNNVLLF